MTDRLSALEIDGVTQEFSLRHEKTLRGLFVTKVLRRHPTKETFTALDDLNFTIEAGSTLGLIGHNGSGKSTLLKIIGGVLTPTRGEVRRRGSLAALLELGAGFHHDLTGRENVFLNAEVLGIPRAVARARFDEIVEFSGVEQFIDTPMKFYSSGMFVRLGFAVAIFAEPDILLVDEVLAVGDEAFQRKCLDVVRRFQDEGRTIVLVTHDMRQVSEFCDRAVLLDHGRIVSDGPPGPVIGDFRTAMGHPEADDHLPPPVVIDSVEMSTGTNEDLLSVEVVTRFVGTADDFVAEVALATEGGAVLVAGSTADAGLPPGINRRRAVSFRFTELPLAPGRYRVIVSARSALTGRVWASDGGCRIDIEGQVSAPLRSLFTARDVM